MTIEKDLSNKLIAAMIKQHTWRQSFNGANIGLGTDPYAPLESYHYPEAYALWGRGYSSLYALTDQSLFLDLARVSATWLIDNTNPKYRHFSWGLPWTWKAWQAPPDISYVTTSVAAGELLLDLSMLTKNDSYLEVGRSIADWIVYENGMEETKDGLWLNYANFPPLRFPVFNAIALASGYFARLHFLTEKPNYRELSLKTARFVLAHQRSDGSWPYSVESQVVDNVHTAYTLKGLWHVYPLLTLEQQQKLIQGVQFYKHKLFAKTGLAKQRTFFTFQDLKHVSLKRWIADQLARLGLLSNRVAEAPLWSYGAALNVFAIVGQVQPDYWIQSERIFDYVEKHLNLPNGNYSYRYGEDTPFIRHQAYWFAGMGVLANSLLKS